MNLSTVTNAKKQAPSNPYLKSSRTPTQVAAPSATSHHLKTASPAATIVTGTSVSTPSSMSTAASVFSPYAAATQLTNPTAASFGNGAAAASSSFVSPVAQKLDMSTAAVETIKPNTYEMPDQNDNDKMIYDDQGNLKDVGSIDWSNRNVWALLAEHNLDNAEDVPSHLESQINIAFKLFSNSQMIAAMTKLQVEAGVQNVEVLTTKKSQQKWFVEWYAKHTNLSIAATSASANSHERYVTRVLENIQNFRICPVSSYMLLF